MLKIKDNVSIEEFQKFGFERIDDEDKTWWGKVIKKDDKVPIFLALETDTDGILLYFVVDEDKKNKGDGYYISCDDTIYDLVQAGLVEKVEE